MTCSADLALRSSRSVGRKYPRQSTKKELDSFGLREIYRKQCVIMRKWDFATCEDLAQEMFCIAWETHKRKGIAPQNCTVKWMLGTSMARVFGRYRRSGVSEYCEYDPALPIVSDEDVEEWFASNWANLSIRNGGNGKRRARYKIQANGTELEMDSDALSSLLKSKEVTYCHAAISNFLRRGAVFWLLDGKLLRSTHPVKGAMKINVRFVERIR